MRRPIGKQFKRTTLTFIFCVTLLIGIGLAHTGHLLANGWWTLSLLPTLFAVRRRDWWAVVWVIALGMSLGWWRGSV